MNKKITKTSLMLGVLSVASVVSVANLDSKIFASSGEGCNFDSREEISKCNIYFYLSDSTYITKNYDEITDADVAKVNLMAEGYINSKYHRNNRDNNKEFKLIGWRHVSSYKYSQEILYKTPSDGSLLKTKEDIIRCADANGASIGSKIALSPVFVRNDELIFDLGLDNNNERILEKSRVVDYNDGDKKRIIEKVEKLTGKKLKGWYYGDGELRWEIGIEDDYTKDNVCTYSHSNFLIPVFYEEKVNTLKEDNNSKSCKLATVLHLDDKNKIIITIDKYEKDSAKIIKEVEEANGKKLKCWKNNMGAIFDKKTGKCPKGACCTHLYPVFFEESEICKDEIDEIKIDRIPVVQYQDLECKEEPECNENWCCEEIEYEESECKKESISELKILECKKNKKVFVRHYISVKENRFHTNYNTKAYSKEMSNNIFLNYFKDQNKEVVAWSLYQNSELGNPDNINFGDDIIVEDIDPNLLELDNNGNLIINLYPVFK